MQILRFYLVQQDCTDGHHFPHRDVQILTGTANLPVKDSTWQVSEPHAGQWRGFRSLSLFPLLLVSNDADVLKALLQVVLEWLMLPWAVRWNTEGEDVEELDVVEEGWFERPVPQQLRIRCLALLIGWAGFWDILRCGPEINYTNSHINIVIHIHSSPCGWVVAESGKNIMKKYKKKLYPFKGILGHLHVCLSGQLKKIILNNTDLLAKKYKTRNPAAE